MRALQLQSSSGRKKSGKFRVVWLMIGLILVTFLFKGFGLLNNPGKNSLLSPRASRGFIEGVSSHNQPQISPNLKKAVEDSLEGSKGKYYIYIKNLKTGELYYRDEHIIVEPGSLYKLWIMGTAYQQIKEGTLSKDEVLSRDIAYLNDKFSIPDETAELTEGSISLTVEQALNQMITISHNYAALLLTERVKLSSVSQFLKDNHFDESKVSATSDPPTSSAYDIALFFEKLYNGKLVDTGSSMEMLEILKNQQLNDKIPKNLPDNIEIAHKTGEIDYFSHDGGIVFTPKGDYIIVVLSESDTPAAANDRIADLSEAVYNYFTK